MTARRGRTHWARIQQLFEEALDLPPEDRRAFLDRTCASDRALREEIERLLEADRKAGGLDRGVEAAVAAELGGPTSDDAEDRGPSSADSSSEARSDPASADPMGGRRIGPYRIIRELGRGGMGRIYLAERADEAYRGQVAIKLVRSDGPAGELAERFRTERQVLAELAHPNIARLLDGGTTAEGEPYLVMEHVEGEAIDAWCDRQRLSVEDRVRLARKVCAAVQHAHSALIVHRDLKASNILVTADGTPKLLDFGIAKLLDPTRSAELALHRTGDATRLFTPSAASPEQLRGESVTTATDVYALGVLLYELLTGCAPYRHRPGDAIDLHHAILEEEPVRPSVAVRGPDAAAGTALRGTTTPERLARRLAGDLDTILLMALRKDPKRRYESVAQLSEDLERHLRSLPVLARGDSFSYLARRFVRRHRTAVAAVVAVVLSVSGLVGFYTARLASERDRARVEARRAAEMSDFLVGLFGVSDPELSRGEAITARELLDRGATRVERELSAEPQVRATMMGVIGDAYAALGLYDSAEELLSRLVEDRRRAVGELSDPALAEALHALGVVTLRRGEHARADTLLSAALAARRELYGSSHSDVVESLLSLAALADVRGEYEIEGERLEEAERIVAALSPPDSARLVQTLMARAQHQNSTGQYDSAVARYEAGVDISRSFWGPEHRTTLMAASGLGNALERAGRLEEARQIRARNLEILEEILPPEHWDVGSALKSLASTLKLQGRSAEAVPLQERALSIFRQAVPGDHPITASTLNELANLRHDLRDLEGALELHNQSEAMNRRLFGDDHPSLADSYNNKAAVLGDMGDLEGALTLYRRTLEHDRRTLGEDHPWIGFDMVAIATAVGRLGRLGEAEDYLRRAIDQIRRASGPRHLHMGNALRELGWVLYRTDRCGEAEPLLLEARSILTEAYPGDPWETALLRSIMGACRAVAGGGSDAEALLRSGHERLLELRGPDDWMVRIARDLLDRHAST